MAQTKRKFGKFWWVTLTVAVLMAVVFAVETPLCAYAEGTKEKYLKEVIMITAKDATEAQTKVDNLNKQEVAAAEKIKEENAKKAEKDRLPVPTPKHYYLFETPIYDIEGVTTKTYIAYTTTNNVKKSLKAMKVMNMKGKWSYEEYDKYLDDLSDKTEKLTRDLYEAIKEYATHVKAEKKNALYAKEILEFLRDDDSGLNLSDLFVKWAGKRSYEVIKNDIITFFMQANKNILVTVECALMIACKDSYIVDGNDVNFLTGMQTEDFLSSVNGYYKNTEYAKYDVYVQDILVYLPQIQKDLRFYMSSHFKLEDDAEQVFKEVQDEILAETPKSADEFTETKDAIMEDLKKGPKEEQAVANFDSYFKNLSKEDQESYTNGKMYYNVFTACKYTGYNNKDTGYKNQYENLLGLFMAHEAKTKEELQGLYNNYDFYPLIDLLSPGQRGLLKVGLPQLISATLGTTDLLDAKFDLLISDYNAGVDIEEEKIKKGQTVSVYYEVDRSLYEKDSGIALTSEAVKATETEPLEHVNNSAEKAAAICDIIAMAAGAVALTTVLTGAAMITYMYLEIQYNTLFLTEFLQGTATYAQAEFVAKPITLFFNNVTVGGTSTGYGQFTNIVAEFVSSGNIYSTSVGVGESVGVNVTFSQCMSNFFSMTVGSVIAWITAVSIGVIILVMIFKYVYPLIATENDEAYIDIPRVMCSYEAVFGQTPIENCEPVKDYIYYYGVKNPLLSDEDNTRANTRDGVVHKDEGDDKKDTDILKFGETVQIETTNAEGKQVTENVKRGGIGDIANWNLRGLSRQWVAIYTSSDPKAGNPILATSLKVVKTSQQLSDDKDLIPVKIFHENSAYDFHRQYATTINQIQPNRYLAYKCDNTATTTTQTASVFSDITLWGGAAAGLILGGGIGTLVTYAIIRKRKKKTVQNT